jgi:hypothetical protein
MIGPPGMHAPTFAALLPGLLCAILATGCAARYQQPEPSAPHAIVAFPSQAEQWGAALFLEPVEFNGVPRPRDWMRDSFRVPPGELRLRVRAAQENMQGTCLLMFPALEGETYAVDAGSAPDTFTIRASRDGRLIADCDAPKTLLPTPLGSPPGTPPR